MQLKVLSRWGAQRVGKFDRIMVVCQRDSSIIYITCVTLHKIFNLRYQTISSLIISQLKYWLSSVNHHNHTNKENQIIQCAWRHALKVKKNLAWWPSNTDCWPSPWFFMSGFRIEIGLRMMITRQITVKKGKWWQKSGAWWWNNGQINNDGDSERNKDMERAFDKEERLKDQGNMIRSWKWCPEMGSDQRWQRRRWTRGDGGK